MRHEFNFSYSNSFMHSISIQYYSVVKYIRMFIHRRYTYPSFMLIIGLVDVPLQSSLRVIILPFASTKHKNFQLSVFSSWLELMVFISSTK